MYSFHGLKAIKTVLVWLLVRIVLGIEAVVQRTALNRSDATDRRWNKNEVYLSSPDTLLIL